MTMTTKKFQERYLASQKANERRIKLAQELGDKAFDGRFAVNERVHNPILPFKLEPKARK